MLMSKSIRCWVMDVLNRIARCGQKPILKAGELELNTRFRIHNIRRTKSLFGNSVLVELDNYAVFLPRRISDYLTEEKIDELLRDPRPLYLIYLGKEDARNPTSAHCFEFQRVDDEILGE